MFDDFLAKELFTHPESKTQKIAFPAVNIKEQEKAWELEVVVPGIRKEELNISIENNKLVVSAQRNETSENQSTFNKREYVFSGFSRSFTLSDQMVDLEQITAKHENGVLYITLPKLEKERLNSKKIEIV
jgi:HSP20 family protein